MLTSEQLKNDLLLRQAISGRDEDYEEQGCKDFLCNCPECKSRKARVKEKFAKEKS